MKKVALSLGFGILGVLFQWGLPFVAALLWPGDGMQHHGEDEAGRRLQVYFLLGSTLFFVLGAWIGSVYASDRRKASRMIVGVLLATVMVLTIPRMVVPAHPEFDGWRYDLIFVLVWVTVAAGLAYGLGRRPAGFAAGK